MKIRMILLALCLLTACGAPAPGPEADDPTEEGPPSLEEGLPSLAEDEAPVRVDCRIVDGAEDGTLLLAGLEDAGVFRLPLSEAVAVTLDGQPAGAADLRDGMTVTVSYNGAMDDSFPAVFGEVCCVAAYALGARENPGGTYYDLCGLYLQVLDDLWQKDPALNEGIACLALDLSDAPGGLTESEKAAVVLRFGELHGVEAFAASFGELREQGRIAAEPLGDGAPEGAAFLHWEDGCLFSITSGRDHAGESYSLPVLFFDAEKWRSSLGAYGFYGCSAVWPMMGTWSGYQVEDEMIA